MGPQEDYIETVFTCEGDYNDPHLQDRLEDFTKSLKDLLLTDKSKLILKKVEPWNSVRVTFNIPREAAVRLKQLAQQGNSTLRDLGVLAVQIQDQHISLTIAGRNNERTQLVFRTAESSTATAPSLSVFDTNSPSLDELGPQGPGPSHVNETSRNIADYLRQGSFLETLFSRSKDLLNGPGVPGDRPRGKVNNILPTSSEHAGGQHPPFMPTPQHSHGNPTNSNPSMISETSSQTSQGQGGMKFPQIPGLPPGLAPGMPQGPRHSMDNLPPPPPYPHGSSYMNNLQNLRFNTTGTSPLLVNLLQNDPNFFAGTGRMPMDGDPLQPPKKKRKPRKPKEKKKPVDGELPRTSVPHVPVQTSTTVEGTSVASTAASLSHTVTTYMNRDLTVSSKEHPLHHVQSVHNMNVQNRSERTVPFINPNVQRRPEEADTAGKIINPVTGLLEPMENLSDTSPSKSDSGKVSPRSLGQKFNTAGDVLSGISIKKEGDTVGSLGRHPNLHHSDMKLAEHSKSNRIPSPGHAYHALSSSQVMHKSSSDMLQTKQYQEALKNELLMKTLVKNDRITPSQKIEQRLPSGMIKHDTSESKGNSIVLPTGSVELPTQRLDTVKPEGLTQDSDKKLIPPTLLNKPLLQVKHNSVGVKPSGSPDSNGDSECSAQSINNDPQNGTDPGVTTGQQTDPRYYNNDSGVGSCSERSDDTPSEPGDSDYKSGNSNSFECAKTPVVLDSVKQVPPNSKIVTVGYAISESHKDIINHKIVSHLTSEKVLNSKLETSKLKSDKLELCSTSQSPVLNWTVEEQHRTANCVDLNVKHSVHEGNVNRRSPKFPASVPTHSQAGDLQMNSMQGTSESSMHKKKSSPRNSPRGSPRNPSSPRNPNSPRGSASPRTSDPHLTGHSRQSFLTAQEYAAHLPSKESQSKSPYSEPGKSPHNEQRKSPFNMILAPNSSALLNKPNQMSSYASVDTRCEQPVGVESVRASTQCNIDNIAILKSIEAQAHHLGSRDILQKLEELKPFFQKLQQHAAQAVAAPPMANGLENMNHSARAPSLLGTLQKSLASLHNVSDFQSALEMGQVPNNLHPLLNMAVDRENANVNCLNTKANKMAADESKGATTHVSSASSRRSLGSVTNNSVPFSPFDSSIPPPKRLTESVQKLFPPPFLDNSLPHVNRRSPSSCGSGKRTATANTVSPPTTGSRGSSSTHTGNKTPVSELLQIDLDNITPTITGLGLGPLESTLDHSNKNQVDLNLTDSLGMPSLPLVDSQLSQLFPNVSTAPTKLVPAVTGSIPAHKTYTGDSIASSTVTSSAHPSWTNETVSVSAAAGDSSLSHGSEHKQIMCNIDNKMATTSSAIESGTGKQVTSSTGPGPPVLHPQTVRYPTPKHVEKPKSPYQQMGLSEMLQETANIHSISNTSTSSSSPIVPPPKLSGPSLQPVSQPHLAEKKGEAVNAFVEKLQRTIDSQLREDGTMIESKNVPNCDFMENLKTEPNKNSGNESPDCDSDIPRLKPQTSASCEKSNPDTTSYMSGIGKNKYTDNGISGKADRLIDSSSCSSSSPPVLIAMSQIPDPKSQEDKSSDRDTVSSDSIPSSKASNSSVSKEDKTSASQNITSEIKHNSNKESKHSDSVEYTSSDIRNSNVDHNETSSRQTPTNEVLKSSVAEDSDSTAASIRAAKILKKRRGSSESIDDKSEEPDLGPRQLRSRKRTNPGEGEGSNCTEDVKRLKLDNGAESGGKSNSAKDAKNASSDKKGVVNSSLASDSKPSEDSNSASDSIKSGLRVRTSVKSSSSDDKDKGKPPSGRDSKKDGKVVAVKSGQDKKGEQAKTDEKKGQANRRNRLSPSAQLPDKQPPLQSLPRDKSPLRGSRTRGRNSPVLTETNEETQENKRTTRSAKSKAEPVAQPASKVPANKRRRTSQDHR